VETAEHAEILRAAGCRQAQGFHFARPMPPDALIDYLAARIETRGALQAKATTRARCKGVNVRRVPARGASCKWSVSCPRRRQRLTVFTLQPTHRAIVLFAHTGWRKAPKRICARCTIANGAM